MFFSKKENIGCFLKMTLMKHPAYWLQLWTEAGHAIVGTLLPYHDPVSWFMKPRSAKAFGEGRRKAQICFTTLNRSFEIVFGCEEFSPVSNSM